MRDVYDAIVIGAGHNGLVAAAYLAKAGLRVLVLERRGIVGGAAATEEVFPGYQVDTGAFDAGLFLPELNADLGLERHGLRWIEPPALVFAPQPDGRALVLWRDVDRSAEEIARFSKTDAERYPAYLRYLRRIVPVFEAILRLAPPELPELHSGELLPWMRLALKARRLGGREMVELLRVLPMPAADFLDEWFESPVLKAVLGAAGLMGSRLGPKAPGTALLLLYQACGAGPGSFRASRFVQGGTGRLSLALAAAAGEYGAEICTGMSVHRILIKDGQAVGVALQDGEQIQARAVVSSADPKQTFLILVGAPNLEVRFVREIRNIRYRGSTARLNLALNGLPSFHPYRSGAQGDPAALAARIQIGPDLEYLERASDAAKYGEYSQRPLLDAAIPTLRDPSLAPAGRHIMTINIQYAPYHLENGTWEVERERLGDRVLDLLSEYTPGLRELILQRQVLTPLDLEREYGLPEGNIHHGEMSLDQLLFMRPVPGASRYRTPVGRLYLCGAGAHPGGGLTGAPGYNAARQILKQVRA